jgi:hypothetical protein
MARRSSGDNQKKRSKFACVIGVAESRYECPRNGNIARSAIKTWMRQRLKEFETVRECVDAAFKNCPNVSA